MNRTLRTRIAPTPSGYLHLGNAWSFLLTWLYARKAGGYVHLRIDDIDPDRYRDAYAHDIFESLQWLGLNHDGGPAKVSDFLLQRRLQETSPRHSEALRALTVAPNHHDSDDITSESESYLFECNCSRESIKRALAMANPKGIQSPVAGNSLSQAIYPGTCRHRKVKDPGADLGLGQAQPTALRWHVPLNTQVTLHDLHLGKLTLSPGQEVGDIVVRTRRGGIAYHLASIADDQALEMNFIVRGEDLLPSTGVQLALANTLGFTQFTSALFVHHPLVLRHGQKLSKSEGAESLKSLRERGIPATAIYRYFAQTLALPAEAGESLQALLQAFPGEQAVLPKHPLAFEHFEEFLS